MSEHSEPVHVDKILNALETLTPREHEVLNQMVSGRPNKEIAFELGITIRTVKAHRRRVMEKMEVNSLAELVTMIITARLNSSTPALERHFLLEALETKQHATE